MHVPDGFLDAPTSIATGAIAAGALGISLRRAERELRDSGPALAGLTAAFVFAVQLVNFPVGAAMLGWHLLIGIGEAVITAAVLSAVVATRPDLVYVARDLRPELVLIDHRGRATTVSADRPVGAVAPGRSAGAAVAVTLLVAGVVSLYASASPDGLQYVAGRLGFDGAAKGSSGPLAGYTVRGIGDGHLSGAVAGIVGVLVTIAAGLLIAKLSSLRSRSRAADPGT